MPLAHSGDGKRGISAQDYAAHVNGVVSRAMKAACDAARYAACDGELLKKTVVLAAEFHDLGKLNQENQDVLSGSRMERRLPVQHTDAGTAYLLDKLHVSSGAVLVRSHHIGLPDFVEEQNRQEESVFRDDSVIEKVNRSLPELIHLHYMALRSVAKMSESA